MLNIFIIAIGRTLSKSIQLLNIGNGSTWPGHIALSLNKRFIKEILKNSPTKIIFVIGTNGKTTTTSLINHLLTKSGNSVVQNTSGANLLNGIASTLLLNASLKGRLTSDFVLFEIDENIFSYALKEVHPDYIVMLNLFRDQLDRYGEVNTIAKKWKAAIKGLPSNTTLILNADDPQIAYIGDGIKNTALYYGLKTMSLGNTEHEHASDSTYCPRCSAKLHYTSISYSHLGQWHCTKCNLSRPELTMGTAPTYPLSGTYNMYNTHAALLLLQATGVSTPDLTQALKIFQPVFGRQEELIIKGKRVKVFLAKNPTGFNESLRTIAQLKAKHLLIVLNDRIADGKDISWIWDIDLEDFVHKFSSITLSGERVHDMALRIKYTHKEQQKNVVSEPVLKKAVAHALKEVEKDETLFILPTYTAMLQIREIMTGKKIL